MEVFVQFNVVFINVSRPRNMTSVSIMSPSLLSDTLGPCVRLYCIDISWKLQGDDGFMFYVIIYSKFLLSRRVNLNCLPPLP